MKKVKMRTIPDLQNSVAQHHGHITQTYEDQDEVEEQILELYRMFSEKTHKDSDVPILAKEKHSTYLRRGLSQLSDSYEALDASRPWLCYWILHAMNLLELKVSPEEKIRITNFISKCQNLTDGGFGGGPGQFSHLAATYAAINALICLTSSEALKVVHKEKLYEFISKMRMEDGSFRMHRGGEIDVRAVYCAVVVTELTNTGTPSLFDRTAEWVIRCQTYEGGFGGFPGMEAHGGYTFCALATLILLKRTDLINVNSLLRWLSNRQMKLEGGFSGRTNKLVDGCYAFWQGASFALLGQTVLSDLQSEGDWLFTQSALQEYLLICCQHPLGGLIDKPGKQRDYYHTCYALSGLAISQHSKTNKIIVGSPSNLLCRVHPVFNLTMDSVLAAQSDFGSSAGGNRGQGDEERSSS